MSHITSCQEEKNRVLNSTIEHKVFDPKTKEIKFVETKKIEKCLAPVSADIKHSSRDSKYATVEVRFSSVEAAMKHSVKTLRTSEMVLLPSYMGCKTSHIRIEEVSVEVEVAWVLATLLQGRNNKTSLLQID